MLKGHGGPGVAESGELHGYGAVAGDLVGADVGGDVVAVFEHVGFAVREEGEVGVGVHSDPFSVPGAEGEGAAALNFLIELGRGCGGELSEGWFGILGSCRRSVLGQVGSGLVGAAATTEGGGGGEGDEEMFYKRRHGGIGFMRRSGSSGR